MPGRRYLCTSGDGTTLEIYNDQTGLSLTVEWDEVWRCIRLSPRQAHDLAAQLRALSPVSPPAPEWEDIP